MINLIKLNHIRSQFKLFYSKKNKKFSQNDSEDLKTLASLEKILNISSQFAKEKGTELYFIFLPSYNYFITYNKVEDICHSNKVINIGKKLGFKIIDFREDIKKLNDSSKLYPFSLVATIVHMGMNILQIPY